KEYASIDKDYAFQFIDHNGRQIMKTDTMSASVKSYLNYYRKKPEYEILHMNGFKTKDRFIKFKSDWGQCDTCGAITELAKIDDTEFLHLYEYCPLSDTLIKIQIGDISQDSHIQFYDRSWFLKNVSKGLSIHLPEGDFKPAYLEFILYDPIKDNNFIRTDNINNDKLKTLWNQLPDIAGMYIQNIVFVDTQGNRTRIPNTFHFNISK
ncbi:MAG TPA: hypothetical protein VK590_05950, partial [Saprospiraceae bacterium]|nr:hypothetical protein [Saprospiraceae bacterium]